MSLKLVQYDLGKKLSAQTDHTFDAHSFNPQTHLDDSHYHFITGNHIDV